MENENENEYTQTVNLRENPLEGSYHVYGMQQNSDVVFDFLQGERGYFWNKNKNAYEKFNCDEDNFNELGLKDLHNILHSVVNRSNVLADLKISEINKIMERTMITIIKNMTRNKKRWQLKEHARDSILQNCKNQMKMFLSKTKEGRAATLFYGNVSMDEDFHHKNEVDQGGIPGMIRGGN